MARFLRIVGLVTCIVIASAKQQCAAKHYQSFGICRPTTPCAPDRYEFAAPTDIADRKCAPISICGDRELELVAPSPTSDRKCKPCAETDECGKPSDVYVNVNVNANANATRATGIDEMLTWAPLEIDHAKVRFGPPSQFGCLSSLSLLQTDLRP
jgi:hypothetical protein